MAVKEINWAYLISYLKKANPEKVILFGSYATGNPSSESDVDVLIIKNIQDKDKRNEKIRLKHLIREFVLKYGVSIDIHIDTPQNIQKRIEMGDYFYKEILEKGKVLYAS
ncbi:MAG: nucleotidyltransferase domain-containing protein [Bacteroidales bacterium]